MTPERYSQRAVREGKTATGRGCPACRSRRDCQLGKSCDPGTHGRGKRQAREGTAKPSRKIPQGLAWSVKRFSWDECDIRRCGGHWGPGRAGHGGEEERGTQSSQREGKEMTFNQDGEMTATCHALGCLLVDEHNTIDWVTPLAREIGRRSGGPHGGEANATPYRTGADSVCSHHQHYRATGFQQLRSHPVRVRHCPEEKCSRKGEGKVNSTFPAHLSPFLFGQTPESSDAHSIGRVPIRRDR
ncbi:hypothetical protein K456DRAFT_930127 [Colletotrichum gloeosporioides 23]|nr:hypothetical protein K456DRAFT_930127 [Colletotrichum gloeosporioides 23]